CERTADRNRSAHASGTRGSAGRGRPAPAARQSHAYRGGGLDPRNRRAREGGAVRRHHAKECSCVCRSGRGFRFVRRDHSFGARQGHQLPAGACVNIAEVRAALPQRHIEYYESIDSTMHAASKLETGAVVFAGEQKSGQGRHGHVWHSEARNGLYCSLVLQPSPVLTLALGLAAAEAIAGTYGIACDLRWPNDLMLDGLKTGGILVQLVDGKAV